MQQHTRTCGFMHATVPQRVLLFALVLASSLVFASLSTFACKAYADTGAADEASAENNIEVVISGTLEPDTVDANDINTFATSDLIEVTVPVTYGQSEARTMTDMINSFRTGSDAWYWNSDNTTKTVCTNLSPLTYDYDLEKVAMQRAAELALFYDHSRPDGTSWSTAYSEFSYRYTAAAENIAASTHGAYIVDSSASDIFTAWREDNADYSGQGHRRNLLSSDYTSLGVGFVMCNGREFWVLELAGSTSSSTATPANESLTNVTCNVALSNLNYAYWHASLENETLMCGESEPIPTVEAMMQLTNTWLSDEVYVWMNCTWESSDPSIAVVEDGMVVAQNKPGTFDLTCELLDATFTISVYKDVATLDVVILNSSYTYDGNAKTPTVTVRDGRTTLTLGRDYTVSYADNVNAGTAIVTITGMGDYLGSKDVYFEIAPAQINRSMFVVDTTDASFTGYAIARAITTDLVAGTDYTVTYKNNLRVGTANLVISGCGNYTGDLAYTFNIVMAPVNSFNGSNRYNTMQDIVHFGFFPENTDAIVIASGEVYADALTAASLAGALSAPIVLTNGKTASDEAKELIEYLDPSVIYVIGGPNAVSDSVARELAALAGVSFERISGDTRVQTAEKVAETVANLTWSASTTAIITCSETFADALSVSPYAYATTSPIFLTDSTSKNLTNRTLSIIKEYGYDNYLIVGGETSVPSAVEDQLESAGLNGQRISGATRYDTSCEFAEYAVSEGVLSFNGFGVATGEKYPDALAGGALCGKAGSVLLLAKEGVYAPVYLVKAYSSNVDSAYFFGGYSSLSEHMRDRFTAAGGL